MKDRKKVQVLTIKLDNAVQTEVEFSEEKGDIPRAITINDETEEHEIFLDDELIDILIEGMEEMGWLDE